MGGEEEIHIEIPWISETQKVFVYHFVMEVILAKMKKKEEIFPFAGKDWK